MHTHTEVTYAAKGWEDAPNTKRISLTGTGEAAAGEASTVDDCAPHSHRGAMRVSTRTQTQV